MSKGPGTLRYVTASDLAKSAPNASQWVLSVKVDRDRTATQAIVSAVKVSTAELGAVSWVVRARTRITPTCQPSLWLAPKVDLTKPDHVICGRALTTGRTSTSWQ